MEVTSLSYEDVLLLPSKVSDVTSPSDVDLSTTICGGIKLEVPIIAAPMTALNDASFFTELRELGGIGCVHRFQPLDEQLAIAGKPGVSIISVPMSTDSWESFQHERLLKAAEAGHRLFLVDVANGYNRALHSSIQTMRARLQTEGVNNSIFISGNVCEDVGYLSLYLAGCQGVRVGIGTGSACTTRAMTGVGAPILGSIRDAYLVPQQMDVPKPTIIADGGIIEAADIAKAIAFGADAVMIGRLFAERNWDGKEETTRRYSGSASFEVQQLSGKVGRVEGASFDVPVKGTLAEFMAELKDGIRSACGYLNAPTVKDLVNCRYRVVSAANREGYVRMRGRVQ